MPPSPTVLSQTGARSSTNCRTPRRRRTGTAHATYFHITLLLDELNVVESLLARADSFAFEQDEGEFRACVAELKSQLLVLSEMQEISIQNIL